ncbi:hypothetical protein RPD_0661 [Rhodopseudomonas palustris BisB5]|uniref:Uncharacterized protein n=1 Tax=Rhodopseudomonas palustris (strain BisB5) TaxID=316057 RepID=Q13DE0_RHOPS|nr:hypothetical protein RPD_0661 [Rhodopseudomonas palustris BisB5]
MSIQVSWSFSSKPIAGVCVADRQREEADTEGQHDDVQHEMCSLRLPITDRRANDRCRSQITRPRPIATDGYVPHWAYGFEGRPLSKL